MRHRIFRRYHRRLIREFEDRMLERRMIEDQNLIDEIREGIERAFSLEHDIIMENRRRMESGEFRAVGINGVLNKN